MKIINTGSVRIRVEGYGYVNPGQSITVPEDTGRQLCTEGSDFREAKKPLSVTEISSAVAKKSSPEVKKPVSRRTRKNRQKVKGIRDKAKGTRDKG